MSATSVQTVGTWDPTARAGYLTIRSGRCATTTQETAIVLCDYDAKGHLVGVEVLLDERPFVPPPPGPPPPPITPQRIERG